MINHGGLNAGSIPVLTTHLEPQNINRMFTV
jgi:hypothetical protein